MIGKAVLTHIIFGHMGNVVLNLLKINELKIIINEII